MTKKQPYRNLDKQEAIVQALWKFAHKAQTHPGDCEAEDGTCLYLSDVTDSLTEIMAVFGYEVVHVE